MTAAVALLFEKAISVLYTHTEIYIYIYIYIYISFNCNLIGSYVYSLLRKYIFHQDKPIKKQSTRKKIIFQIKSRVCTDLLILKLKWSENKTNFQYLIIKPNNQQNETRPFLWTCYSCIPPQSKQTKQQIKPEFCFQVQNCMCTNGLFATFPQQHYCYLFYFLLWFSCCFSSFSCILRDFTAIVKLFT